MLKYSIDFREYREVMKKAEHVPGVIGIAPFVINPMMVTHGDRTATGVLLKGVDPELMPRVLDLPKHITLGSLAGMRRPGAKPPQRMFDDPRFDRDPGQKDALRPDGDKGDKADPPSAPDAGTDGEDSLLEAIGRAVAEDASDAGRHEDVRGLGELAPVAPALPKGAPIGSVLPDGGFASILPPDDVPLPDDIDPDPCKSAEQVAQLPGVVIGRTLSKQLNVVVGDCLQITSPTIGISIGASGSRPPIAKQFRVIAVFEAGFDQYDSKLVYTDLYADRYSKRRS